MLAIPRLRPVTATVMPGRTRAAAPEASSRRRVSPATSSRRSRGKVWSTRNILGRDTPSSSGSILE